MNQVRCEECRKKAHVREQTEYMQRKRAAPSQEIVTTACTKCSQEAPCELVRLSEKPQFVCQKCRRALYRKRYERQGALRIAAITRTVTEAPKPSSTPMTCKHRSKNSTCTHPTAPWGDCLTQRCRGLCAMGFAR